MAVTAAPGLRWPRLTDCVTCTVLRAVPTAAASPAVEAVLLQDAAQLARAHPNCGAPPGLTADAFWFAPPGAQGSLTCSPNPHRRPPSVPGPSTSDR